jgi:hypothetical protein
LLAFWRSPAVLLPFAVALVVLGARKYKSPSKTTGTATDTRSAMAKARQWDTESVLLCVVPMLAARAFSAQQSLQCSTSALQHAAVILLAFLLLMALRPKRNYFTGRCRRCFTLCSRSIASQFPHCPSCAPEKFHEERRDQVGATAGETPPESRV